MPLQSSSFALPNGFQNIKMQKTHNKCICGLYLVTPSYVISTKDLSHKTSPMICSFRSLSVLNHCKLKRGRVFDLLN